ncbi:MAG: hypothetical protein AAFU33_02115 [Bacteroidota bacterium]
MQVQIKAEKNPAYAVVIEDDQKVAYAYLLHQGKIIGDVWLYNHQTPDHVNWKDKSQLPFLNPAPYVDASSMIAPVASQQDIFIVWDIEEGGELNEVQVHVEGKPVAYMKLGSKPGWSVSASADGPLAKTWKL